MVHPIVLELSCCFSSFSDHPLVGKRSGTALCESRAATSIKGYIQVGLAWVDLIGLPSRESPRVKGHSDRRRSVAALPSSKYLPESGYFQCVVIVAPTPPRVRSCKPWRKRLVRWRESRSFYVGNRWHSYRFLLHIVESEKNIRSTTRARIAIPSGDIEITIPGLYNSPFFCAIFLWRPFYGEWL